MPKKGIADNNQREDFMRLYGPLRPRLARFASAMTSDREEARDLIAETTLTAYERFGELRNEQAFLSWLFTIASRLHKKRMVRERRKESYDEEQARRIPDLGTSPEVSADVALLHDALSRLPDKQREAVVLFEIADMPLKEISKVQGTTLSSVKSRVTRGRRRLAALLGVSEETTEKSSESHVEEEPSEASEKQNGKILYMNAA